MHHPRLYAAAALVATGASAFVSPPSSLPSTKTSSLSSSLQIQEDLTFTRPDTLNEGQISEQACTDAASKMKRVMVPVSKEVSSTGYVGISYINWQAEKNVVQGKKNTLPLLLVHGFDSSALEYRRLGPQLAKLGVGKRFMNANFIVTYNPLEYQICIMC